MKNVIASHLKNAIVLTIPEFESIVHRLFDEDNRTVQFDFSLDGLWVGYDDGEIYTEDLLKMLAKYFGVDDVTSLHLDNEDSMGVWVIYKDKTVTYNGVIGFEKQSDTIHLDPRFSVDGE